MTMLEAREFMLTQTTGLMMQEWCWLEQTCKLVSIMLRPSPNKEIQYNISSYLPKVIPCPEALPPPSTSTSSRTPTSHPMDPCGPSTSTIHMFHLPYLHNLIHKIMWPDPLPMPNSASPYQLVTR